MNKITFDEAKELVQKKMAEVEQSINKYTIAGNDVRRNKYEYRYAGLYCLYRLIDTMDAWRQDDSKACFTSNGNDDNTYYDDSGFYESFTRVCGVAESKQKIVLTPETDVMSLIFDRGWSTSKLIKKCKEQGDVYYDATEKCIKKLPGNLKK